MTALTSVSLAARRRRKPIVTLGLSIGGGTTGKEEIRIIIVVKTENYIEYG
jgi:hypothetical protein